MRGALGLIAVLMLLQGAWGASPATSDWTQWRGPTRDGKLESDQWPESLDENHLRQLWRVALGPSYSGPIIAGASVFVTETRDEKLEVVSAFDRQTGELQWETSWEGAMEVPFFARSNGSWIRSTPAYDEARLYVGGMRDVLVCLDADTGDVVWKVNFVEALGSSVPSFGFVCSPLVVRDALYVQAAGGVLKLSKATGEVVWRALDDGGGMFGSAFSSPLMTSLAGRQQLLVQTRTTLAGLDPETGEELWSEEIPAFRGMNILTPSTFGDTVFTSSYGGRSFAFSITANGASQECTERWTNKVQGYMSTPIIIGRDIYLHLRNQRFTCINLETGETNWKTTPFGKYWSMIANGSRILALDQRGELLLIEATPEEFQLVDSRKISEDETWAHLAVSENQVFIRELNAIVAYQWDEAP